MQRSGLWSTPAVVEEYALTEATRSSQGGSSCGEAEAGVKQGLCSARSELFGGPGAPLDPFQSAPVRPSLGLRNPHFWLRVWIREVRLEGRLELL